MSIYACTRCVNTRSVNTRSVNTLFTVSLLFSVWAAPAFGQPTEFLNQRGISTVDDGNEYYADIDPASTGLRQCVTLQGKANEFEKVFSNTLFATHQGIDIFYEPGLQFRVFWNNGANSEVRTIRSNGAGKGSSFSGWHQLEDPFVNAPTGVCLEYEVLGSVPNLTDWLDRAFGPTQSGDYVGRSFNGRDLEFGRYTSGGERNGNVYFYVQNFRQLSDAIAWTGPRTGTTTGPFATVAIEYSTVSGQGSPSLQYYIYDNNGIRITKADLDGLGEKYLPNVCHACHSGNFIPIDLDAQDFSPAASRSSQEHAFRGLNELILSSDPPPHLREVIEGWYEFGTPQNGDFIPDDWQSSAQLYSEFYKPNCRSCHIATPYDLFPSASVFQQGASYLAGRLCDEDRPMPNAKVPYELFWDSNAPDVFELHTGYPIPCNVFPDFELRITGYTPVDPKGGDLVRINYEVNNIGAGDFDGNTDLIFQLSAPGQVGTVILANVGPIPAGGSTSSFIQRTLGEGVWTFSGEVDTSDNVEERPDNGSNTDSIVIEVDPPLLPNMIMTPYPDSVTYSPSNPQDGENVTFTIRVRNYGDAGTPGPVTVRVQNNNGPYSYLSCPAIARNTSCYLTYQVTAVAGTGQSLTVSVDPAPGTIAETNENDNVRTAYYNVSNQVTCQGTWNLTGVGHGFNTSATGSVVNGCDVYWGSNQPSGTCWETTGIDNMTVTWIRNGNQCPVQASAYRPSDGQTFLYNVSIVP